MSKEYTSNNIEVLDFPQNIRRRPSMYMSGKIEPRMVQEVFDNSVDELPNTDEKTIVVFYNTKTNTIAVRDWGRGIPIENKEEYNQSTLDIVCTKIHAGGKFKGDYNSENSIGMNGVGITAVNALAESFKIITFRNKWYGIEYSKGIKIGTGVDIVKYPKEYMSTDSRSLNGLLYKNKGTLVIFKPDESITRVNIQGEDIKAPGSWTSWAVEKLNKSILDADYIKDYLAGTVGVLPENTRVALVIDGKTVFDMVSKGITTEIERLKNEIDCKLTTKIFEYKKESPDTGAFIDVRLAWVGDINEAYSFPVFSCWCNRSITQAGMHAYGVINSVYSALLSMLPENLQEKASGNIRVQDAILDSLLFAIHFSVKEPMFVSQSKAVLETRVPQWMLNDFKRSFIIWAQSSTTVKNILQNIKKLVEVELKASVSRKEILKVTSKKKTTLSSKLIRSSGSTPDNRELYIVEGESAKGGCKQARDPKYQEILAIKGKIMNLEKYPLTDPSGSEEVGNIVSSIFDPDGTIRINKVFLLADADADGFHISNLVLACIRKYAPELIEQGKVYCPKVPLFEGTGNKTKYYGMTLAEVYQQAKDSHDIIASSSRCKGLAEMTDEALHRFAFNPETRELIQILPSELGNRLFNQVMGEDANFRAAMLKDL